MCMYGQNDEKASFSRVERAARCVTETQRVLRPFKVYDSLSLHSSELRAGYHLARNRSDHNRDYMDIATLTLMSPEVEVPNIVVMIQTSLYNCIINAST